MPWGGGVYVGGSVEARALTPSEKLGFILSSVAKIRLTLEKKCDKKKMDEMREQLIQDKAALSKLPDESTMPVYSGFLSKLRDNPSFVPDKSYPGNKQKCRETISELAERVDGLASIELR